jgi:hypothetical protein
MKSWKSYSLSSIVCGASALILITAAAPGSHAQWSVANLHPLNASKSRANGVRDGKQVGSATFGGVNHAAMWSGSAGTFEDLHPAGWAGITGSELWSAGNGQQAGRVYADGLVRGVLWSGTALSAVDLTPYLAGATESTANTGGGLQVGTVWFGDVTHASLWNGGSASWQDLHPPVAEHSSAHATDGVQQVGRVTVGGVSRASLWYGSSQAWVDLHPDWAGATWSIANSVSDGEQGGYVYFNGSQGSRACVWSGTAGSYVNLHPAGIAGSSEVRGVHGGQQVGYVPSGGGWRATLWSGSAASRFDLHALLPKNTYQNSMAMDIWHDSRYTYVVGYGYNMKTQREEALMWRQRR